MKDAWYMYQGDMKIQQPDICKKNKMIKAQENKNELN